jgi:hypothetical protein
VYWTVIDAGRGPCRLNRGRSIVRLSSLAVSVFASTGRGVPSAACAVRSEILMTLVAANPLKSIPSRGTPET